MGTSLKGFEDLDWKQVQVPDMEGRMLGARFHICESMAECISLRWRFWEEVFTCGGAIFCRVREAARVEERIPGVSKVFYRYEGPPEVALWHMPSCSFSELVDRLKFFDFPKSLPPSDRETAFQATKELLLEFDRRKQIVVERVDEVFLSFRFTSEIEKLTKAEAELIRGFNKKYFGAPLSKFEERDQLQHWVKEGFFTVGDV